MSPDDESSEERESEGRKPQTEPTLDSKATYGLGRWLARLILTLILVAGLALVALYYYADRTLNRPLEFKSQSYSINAGDSLNTLLQQLADTGVITETLTPRLFVRYKKIGGQLHTGDYQFTDGLTLVEVLGQVTTGKGQITSMLTVVEGMTFAQFRSRLAATTSLKQTLGEVSDKQLMQSLFNSDQHPEGLFFPETYQFRGDDTDQSIIQQAYHMMQGKLQNVWAERDPDTPLNSAYEALILASIIEKETGRAGERRLISGVFTNRLRKGMLLQTDPTVIYGLGDQFNGNLTRKHLRTDTIYNTYTRKGLPPTPICLPGLASLEAAVHPETTDALYFVGKGDGSHYFSKSLKQHNRAVRKYQLGQ